MTEFEKDYQCANQLEKNLLVEGVLLMMRTYGGSFAYHLAILYNHADYSNKIKLRTTFSDLFDKYYDMAKFWMVELKQIKDIKKNYKNWYHLKTRNGYIPFKKQ